MGYTAEEAVGSHFSRFYGPEDLANRKPQRELEIASREGRVEDEGWRVRKDGTRFWANTVITSLRDPSGRTSGFAKITRDMSRRRAAEENLRRSEEVFRLLVASVKEYAIFLLDPTGHIVTWNAGARRLKGYEPEEIIGKHFSIFYPPETRETKPAWVLDVARREGSVEDEGWRVRKDGTRFWADVVVTAVYDEDRQLRGFAKVTRDLTERKQAEETRQALLEQRMARVQAEEERRRAEASFVTAQETNRAKDEFLMTLSHELRTPLTAILGWARLLPGMPPGDPSFNDAVAAIARSAQVQARLIDDVLDVSRIVSGKLRLTVEEVDIEKTINAAIASVRPSAEAKNIQIQTEVAPEVGHIVADATRLQQVIWNLLTNAVKFTPKGGTVTIVARRSSSSVQIAVRDTGEGIDPQFLPHVFEQFRQAETPNTRVHGGLGLGLSIVRYLVEAHGGRVTAESAGRGRGATFTIVIPVGALIPHHHTVTVTSSTTTPGPIPMTLQGVEILVVDDDAEGRLMVKTVLERAGASVIDVASVDAALAAYSRHKPRVVLTDIAMPDVDGYELARRIRQQDPKANIVALTAFPAGRSGQDDDVFNAYVLKPTEPSDLVGTLKKVSDR
jgi:PAS domain S-box-containing protein